MLPLARHSGARATATAPVNFSPIRPRPHAPCQIPSMRLCAKGLRREPGNAEMKIPIMPCRHIDIEGTRQPRLVKTAQDCHYHRHWASIAGPAAQISGSGKNISPCIEDMGNTRRAADPTAEMRLAGPGRHLATYTPDPTRDVITGAVKERNLQRTRAGAPLAHTGTRHTELCREIPLCGKPLPGVELPGQDHLPQGLRDLPGNASASAPAEACDRSVWLHRRSHHYLLICREIRRSHQIDQSDFEMIRKFYQFCMNRYSETSGLRSITQVGTILTSKRHRLFRRK